MYDVPVFWHSLTRLSSGSLVLHIGNKMLFDIFLGNSAFKMNHQLVQNLAPVPGSGFSNPFLRTIHHCQIQQFEQCIIGREDGSAFGYLTELTVDVLDGIRCIDDFSQFLRILEICRKLSPVVTP